MELKRLKIWGTGINNMECWSDGVLETGRFFFSTPALHYSITPLPELSDFKIPE
jgi:hypothetical protein